MGISDSCDAFTTSILGSSTASYAASCPSNYVKGAVVVLNTAAATTEPNVQGFPLSAQCNALLDIPAAVTAPAKFVTAGITLVGLTLSDVTPAMQLGFKTTTAAQLNVAPYDVTILDITGAAARRHLTTAGVTIEFAVAAASVTTANALSTSIQALTTTNAAAYTAALQSSGLPSVSSLALAAAAIVMSAPPPPSPPPPRPPAVSGAARAAASAAFVTALAAALF